MVGEGALFVLPSLASTDVSELRLRLTCSDVAEAPLEGYALEASTPAESAFRRSLISGDDGGD